MKTSTLITKLQDTSDFIRFTTKDNYASVAMSRAAPGFDIKVHIGDGDAEQDYQFLNAADFRELAKKFKAIADELDSGAL